MIESGSHQPVDVAQWGLPEGTALRVELPAAPLRAWFEHYSVLDSDGATYTGDHSWILPGPPMLWVALTAPDLTMRPRRRRPTQLCSAMLVGPTSTTAPVEAHGGISIVVPLTARGWARLFTASAADLRDRIVPLEEVGPAGWAEELSRRLTACGDGVEVKGILDGFFADHLPPPTKDEETIGRIERLVAGDDGRGDVSRWHEQVGLGSPRTLARLCERHFGFSPKVLQRRHRFLRSFVPMLVADGRVDFREVPPGYHDVPHFLRDARLLLGMTAKQFVDMPMSYLRSFLRAQAAVISASTPVRDGCA